MKTVLKSARFLYSQYWQNHFLHIEFLKIHESNIMTANNHPIPDNTPPYCQAFASPLKTWSDLALSQPRLCQGCPKGTIH